ncbi:MAG: hypothetical protein ACI81L_002307 [Verrucomicrobiales bacterium]|jgi:hypothetical protein
MNVNETEFAQSAQEIEAGLTTPDVSLIVGESDRRAKVQAVTYRSGLALVAVALLGGLWFTSLRPTEITTAGAPNEEQQVDDPTTTAAPTTTDAPTTPLVVEPSSGLTADMDTSNPGSLVTITSSNDIMGGWFSFELAGADGWEPVVAALQAREINGTPRFVPLGEDLSTEDIGLESPVTLQIPEQTEPGTYRICELGSSRCTNITVDDEPTNAIESPTQTFRESLYGLWSFQSGSEDYPDLVDVESIIEFMFVTDEIDTISLRTEECWGTLNHVTWVGNVATVGPKFFEQADVACNNGPKSKWTYGPFEEARFEVTLNGNSLTVTHYDRLGDYSWDATYEWHSDGPNSEDN